MTGIPRLVLGILVGLLAGVALGAAVYLLASGWLEAQEGLLREAQGLTWNLVPGLGVLGAGLGAWWGWPRG